MKLLGFLLENNGTQLHIDDELAFDPSKKELVHAFLEFARTSLGLTRPLDCRIVADRQKNGITTTAFFDLRDGHMRIYGRNRMLGDILRSIGHELTHAKQYEKGELTDPATDGADGSPMENEANSMAGKLIRQFGRNHPDIFE